MPKRISPDVDVYDLNINAWSQYAIHSDSVPFLLKTDTPLELLIRTRSEDENGKLIELCLTREDGSVLLSAATARVPDRDARFGMDLVNIILNQLSSNQKVAERFAEVITCLKEPDPFALPQRKHPDFYRTNGELANQHTGGFGAVVKAGLLRIRDNTEIELRVDVMVSPLYPTDNFLRIWARWPGSKAFHLVCWLRNSSVKEVLDVESHLKVIFKSNDFYHRISLLHDRWRTSQGLPSVSTPEEMTLLPVPDDLPKPAARGISMKRHRRR